MSNSIIRHLQQYLGANIEKIDPNTQEIDPANRHHRYDLLAQAAIPAVLTAFYKYSRSQAGAAEIAADEGKRAPLDYLLAKNKTPVVTNVASYAGVSENYASKVMDAIADEAVKFLRNTLGSAMNAENLQHYFASQRQSILTHLPADLRMGEILGDDTLDDRTNKMRGPASGIAQAISGILSSPGTKKE